MKRREFLQGITGATVAAAFSPDAPAAGTPSRRPNILLIMTDDQGWGDIHAHGNDQIDTPVMDRLSREGVQFERFYVSVACAPTRASLLTGRYHPACGVSGVTRGLETMRADETTVAELLRDAGYATGIFGKWHNGMHYPNHPNGQGFQEFYGFCAGHWNNYFNTVLDHNGRSVRTQGFITDVLTDRALDFIEQNRETPFLCYVPYNAPHGPFQVPDRYFEKYKKRGLSDREACIYGMVENVDDNIGRLLKKLDDLKLANDTIVLFLTDNGPNSDRFNGEMRGRKGAVDEGGIRVPLFIRWPGRIEAGSRVPTIAAHIDILPTLLDWCGVSMPGGVEIHGRSLAPLIEKRATVWPDRALFSHWSQGPYPKPFPGSVRTQQYRLVRRRKSGYELYDMIADPNQTRNIAAEKPDVAKDLAAKYEAWFAAMTKRPIERMPIPVGYAEAPLVELPAPEAYFEGNVTYKGKAGYANDWLTNWTDVKDRIWWEIDVVEPGRHEVTLLYTCPASDIGSKIKMTVGEASLEGAVVRVHDPRPIHSPDRVPRGEVYEKAWAPLALGAVDLKKGHAQLSIQALSKPGAAVMELKAVRLKRIS